MGQHNFPPARVFETFAKENTERPRGIRSFFNAASASDDYTTIMLVGMRSRIDPAGNGEDALDIIHRAFDPCEELPGIDMDPFFELHSRARTPVLGRGIRQPAGVPKTIFLTASKYPSRNYAC